MVIYEIHYVLLLWLYLSKLCCYVNLGMMMLIMDWDFRIHSFIHWNLALYHQRWLNSCSISLVICSKMFRTVLYKRFRNLCILLLFWYGHFILLLWLSMHIYSLRYNLVISNMTVPFSILIALNFQFNIFSKVIFWHL